MRRILFFVLMVVLLCTAADARRSKERAGVVKDGVFYDKKYEFSLDLDEDWKYKVGRKDDNYRLTLTKNTFEIPPQYLSAQDYTKAPRTVVFVGKTKVRGPALIDSLLSDSYNSEMKKEIFKEFEILNENAGGTGLTREKLVPRDRRSMDIAGQQGFIWTGKAKYRNEISILGKGMQRTKRVFGGYGGCIIGVKRGDHVILIHTICEENYMEDIVKETVELVNTLQWTK
ncbi:MAG: hypothetical protein JSU74_01580 [Candidatus Zixiibacteriota bacterium]|nr:MAG: hypothetical protein JSU74_01580 [candidate division Zixibacteria bacterium]